MFAFCWHLGCEVSDISQCPRPAGEIPYMESAFGVVPLVYDYLQNSAVVGGLCHPVEVLLPTGRTTLDLITSM